MPARQRVCTSTDTGSSAPACGSTRTATDRPGTVTVPVAASHVVPRTTSSLPSCCTGESTYSRPASADSGTVTSSGEALKTASRPSSAGSTSVPTVSSTAIATTPGTWSCPAPGKVTFSRISSGSPSRNSSVECRSRRRSCACADAVAMSSGDGLSAGSARSGAMSGHLSSLSAAIGRPLPNPLS
ncbi:Uncharacterised protein [Mycobacteroides abscessus]|nr:Uncharacterised protein [Mycobacteroides abscessus]